MFRFRVKECKSIYFYQQGEVSVTYWQLLDGVNSLEVVVQNHYAKDYRDFVTNVVKALVNNIDVELIDYRNGSAPVKLRQISCKKEHHTLDTLMEAVRTSTSNVGIFSSGSEGQPKLVFQAVQKLLKAVRVDDQYASTVWGFTVNPSHLSGIQVCLQALCNAACLVDLYKLSRTDILQRLRDCAVTHLSATPTFYRMLSPYDFELPTVQNVTLNGEKTTEGLLENVKECFPNARIRNIYGTTEAGTLMSSSTSSFKVPSRIRDAVDIREGQLFLHQTLVSTSVTTDEWYPTGDLVEVITEEPLTIQFISRLSRTINVGGQNVSPQEVEEVLLEHPMVKDVRVYGRKHKLLGNLVSAEVQTLKKVREKELIDHCRQHLASYKVPRVIKFVDSIAIGDTGKKLS